MTRKLSLNISQSDSPTSPRDSFFTSARPKHTTNIRTPTSASALVGDLDLCGAKSIPGGLFPKRHVNSDEERAHSRQSNIVSNSDPLQDTGKDAFHVPSSVTEDGPTSIQPEESNTPNPIASNLTAVEGVRNRPPPGLLTVDPKLIQWTYIDPSGKVQGKNPVQSRWSTL
jgi:hypothetical protein